MLALFPQPMPERRLLAAVDLGSNSFRLLIGRVEPSAAGVQIRPLDSLKEAVRLAAGLSESGELDLPSQRRAVEALSRFGERLRSFSPDAVRAVATNTLRVAHNARHVLGTAEAALGFPIEVISGREEARLIYLGAAHAMPTDGADRLVVDIGGGSTECIVGRDYQSDLLESAPVGCVTLSRRFFPDGAVDRDTFEHACYAARDALAPIALAYRRRGWRYAVGTSGTAKALLQAVQANLGREVLDRAGLAALADQLVRAGHIDRLRLDSLKADRRPVFAGGLAVMTAVFDELGVEEMRYCNGALRQGVLYDVLGRSAGADMREITVAQMERRHALDTRHGMRLSRTAVALFGQVARGTEEELGLSRALLGWAARLAEIGMTISHEDFHKHSAYILGHADMPGFTQGEQDTLASLALGQTGGLRKLVPLVTAERHWLMVLSLRLAAILHRHRDDSEAPLPALFHKRRRVRVEMPRSWAREHPLSDDGLAAEAQAWNDARIFEAVEYVRI